MMATPAPTAEKTETINIEVDDKKYTLVIKSLEESITFTVSDQGELCSIYIRKLTLKDIKETHNLLYLVNTCGEFSDYLKALAEMKKLSLVKKENKISMNFAVEYLLKKHNVEIDLFPEKTNLEDVIKQLCKEVNVLKEEVNTLKKNKDENGKQEYQELKNSIEILKNENENIKKENISLKEEIKKIKEILDPINNKLKEGINNNKHIFNNKSVIMKENEFNLINLAIKSRLNKEVKELKKLYQATIDGDGALNFHSKCDNIPNTLVLIKSAGNRRFGGFTTQTWDNSGQYKDDKNAFLFSLDKQKIYPYKNNKKAIFCSEIYGPVFGTGYTIKLDDYPIQEKHLYTFESDPICSYKFDGDNNALSESGDGSWIYAIEYEVFQVIFS